MPNCAEDKHDDASSAGAAASVVPLPPVSSGNADAHDDADGTGAAATVALPPPSPRNDAVAPCDTVTAGVPQGSPGSHCMEQGGVCIPLPP